MVKTFVVGILSLFDHKLKLLKINAENEYEALKKGMVESSIEKYKQEVIDWQKSEEYPKTYEQLVDMLYNSDMCVNVLEELYEEGYDPYEAAEKYYDDWNHE